MQKTTKNYKKTPKTTKKYHHSLVLGDKKSQNCLEVTKQLVVDQTPVKNSQNSK